MSIIDAYSIKNKIVKVVTFSLFQLE